MYLKLRLRGRSEREMLTVSGSVLLICGLYDCINWSMREWMLGETLCAVWFEGWVLKIGLEIVTSSWPDWVVLLARTGVWGQVDGTTSWLWEPWGRDWVALDVATRSGGSGVGGIVLLSSMWGWRGLVTFLLGLSFKFYYVVYF